MLELRKAIIGRPRFTFGPFDLMVPKSAYAVLMGPTACGKTTLLETIAGLCPLLEGKILLRGNNANPLSPADRQLGYVPQEGVLFSHLSVEENLSFGLRARRIKPTERKKQVDELTCLLKLESLRSSRTNSLSGGEKQRVALGRALATKPDLLLLDEPFAALDSDSRYELYDLMRSLQKVYQFTVLHVSHHEEDAKQLADVVFTIENGNLLSVRNLDETKKKTG